MILYHIHTNPKLEYTPGEVMTIGSVENKLRQHNLDVTPSFIYDEVKQPNGEVHSFRRGLEQYIDIDEYSKLTDEQKRNFLGGLRAYVHNSSIANREYAMELARKQLHKKLPSRYNCIWLTDVHCLEFWIDQIARNRGFYQLYQVETDHDPFVSTNKLIPNRNKPIYQQVIDAKRYWTPKEYDLKYANDKEYLYTGDLKILRRVK